MVYMKRDKIIVSMSHMVITVLLLLCSALVINCNYAEDEDYLDINTMTDDDVTTLADQGKENLSKYLISRLKQRVDHDFDQPEETIDNVLPMLRKCLHMYDLIKTRSQGYARKPNTPIGYKKDKKNDQQEYSISELADMISRMKQRNGVKLPVLRFGGKK